MDRKTLSVDSQTKNQLDELKVHDRQSYEEVLWELIKFYKSNPNRLPYYALKKVRIDEVKRNES